MRTLGRPHDPGLGPPQSKPSLDPLQPSPAERKKVQAWWVPLRRAFSYGRSSDALLARFGAIPTLKQYW
jgi:hypothetical protein